VCAPAHFAWPATSSTTLKEMHNIMYEIVPQCLLGGKHIQMNTSASNDTTCGGR